MLEMEFQRKRSANYTPEERNILVQCAKRELKIINNRSTTGLTNAEKRAAWERVAMDFNTQQGVTKRTAVMLKKAWDGMKADLRKVQRASLVGTEGGVPTTPELWNNPAEFTSGVDNFDINWDNDMDSDGVYLGREHSPEPSPPASDRQTPSPDTSMDITQTFPRTPSPHTSTSTSQTASHLLHKPRQPSHLSQMPRLSVHPPRIIKLPYSSQRVYNQLPSQSTIPPVSLLPSLHMPILPKLPMRPRLKILRDCPNTLLKQESEIRIKNMHEKHALEMDTLKLQQQHLKEQHALKMETEQLEQQHLKEQHALTMETEELQQEYWIAQLERKE